MTREEAIKWVKFVHDVLYEDKDERIREALDMAIEALQWQDRILTQIEDIVLKEHGERREPHGFVADEWYRNNFGENDGK